MKKAGSAIVIDYETTGYSPYEGATAFTFVLTQEDGTSKIYDNDDPAFFSMLRDFWGDPDIIKVAQNMKFELKFTKAMGIEVRGELHDTMVMHQMLNNLDRHGLDHIVNQIADADDVARWNELDKAVAKAADIYGTYDKIPKYIMHPYQLIDGEREMLAYLTLLPLVQQDEKLYADYLNEIEVIKATVRMEDTGIMIDRGESDKLITWMGKELEDVEDKVFKLVGEPINLGSPKQLMKLLYDKYNFPPVYKIDKKTREKKLSVDKDAIAQLRAQSDHPILDLILRERAYTKGTAMVSSYIKAAGDSHIVHPNINTNAASTGRETSTNPNMQNISKDAALKTRFPVPARGCFRARPRTIFYLIDYKGIEMRLGIQGTKSPRLIQLAWENFDFHDACAISFFGDRYTKEKDAKKKDQLRSAAKNTRFAMFYGAGLAQAAKTLGLTMEEAKEGYDRDKEEWPEFYEFMDYCTKFAKKHGYIETFFGRKLRVYSDKPYVATDYCIQGSAAGVMKRAQVILDKYFREEWDDRIKLLLPIHDEVIIEYPRDLFPQRKEFLTRVRELMVNIECITVPLEVDIETTSTNWNKAQGVNLKNL